MASLGWHFANDEANDELPTLAVMFRGEDMLLAACLSRLHSESPNSDHANG